MYHFVGSTLRGGRPVPPDGEWLEHSGALKMCKSGLHASPTPWEALQHAPGEILCEVEIDGEIIRDSDKVVCRRRKITRRVDLTEVLRVFARKQALRVIHLWNAPAIVHEYLETGKEELRAAARAAARAAGDAARAAAWDAGNAARAAARDAAWDAARAAGDAARAAAWDARNAGNARDAAAQLFNQMALEALAKANPI